MQGEWRAVPAGPGPQKSLAVTQGGPILGMGVLVPFAMGSNGIIPADGPK